MADLSGEYEVLVVVTDNTGLTSRASLTARAPFAFSAFLSFRLSLFPPVSASMPTLAESYSAKANELLATLGLEGRGKSAPLKLSGGQQQRVAIARALVSDPRILICDEPTGDLDRKTADEVLTLLQQLNREFGKTIVMVTHDPKAAEYAKRTVHLDKGSLVDEPSH